MLSAFSYIKGALSLDAFINLLVQLTSLHVVTRNQTTIFLFSQFLIGFILKVNAEGGRWASTSFHLREVCQSITPVPCTALPLCGEPVYLFSQRPTTLSAPLHLSSTLQPTPHLSSSMLWKVAPLWPIVTPSLCRLTPGQPHSQQTLTRMPADDSEGDKYKS